MSDNLELWNRVCKTDPNYTKTANVKGLKITSISPQYQLLNATKEFGTYGKTWGLKGQSFDYSLQELGVVVYKATFYAPNIEFQIMNSISIWRDGARTKLDTDFAKKVETDTLTKALSKIGFNADIFLGKFDDVKYIDGLVDEFREKELLTKDHPKFNDAVKFMVEGGDIAVIEKHYILTDHFNEAISG